MLKIYIARHGQDKDNERGLLNGRRDNDLTDLGIAQARSVGRQIKKAGIQFNQIYCSPLKRTFKTAELISNEINGPDPQTEEKLIERDFGVMTGKPITDIPRLCAPKIFPTKTIIYMLEPEGAETFPQLLKRGEDIVNWIQQSHSDGSILLVTHGDIGKMTYAAYYNLTWQEVLKNFHFGNADLILLSENSPAEESHVFKISEKDQL